MVDDDSENDQDKEDNCSNNDAHLELFDAVKQNSLKIKLIENGNYETTTTPNKKVSRSDTPKR